MGEQQDDVSAEHLLGAQLQRTAHLAVADGPHKTKSITPDHPAS
jgi:hypothetical protein